MSDPNRTQAMSADPNRTRMGGAPVLDANRTLMGSAPSLNATQLVKPTQCPVCKTFNPAGVMFCTDCGLIFDRALPGDAFGAPAVQLPILVDSSGREHSLRVGESIAGREGEVLVNDGRASRRHARLMFENGAVTVEDLGSTNGTTVDGQPLTAGQKATLKSGSKVGFAGSIMTLAMPGEAGGNKTQVFGNRTAAMAAPPRPEKAPATLVGPDKEYPLRPGMNTFGRKPENDVQIAEAAVSGRHGQLEVLPDGVFLTDLGSSNGTFVNGAKLGANLRTQVRPDDVVRIANFEFKLRLANA
ncbi:FHA domain-containing protein [bacterium]|nr:MAG: FHA domain-containing protein [bacterium]